MESPLTPPYPAENGPANPQPERTHSDSKHWSRNAYAGKHSTNRKQSSDIKLVVFCIASLLFLELAFHLSAFGGFSGEAIFFLLFALPVGCAIVALVKISPWSLFNRILLSLLILVITLFFEAQVVYYGVFKTYMAPFSMLGVAGQALDWLSMVWLSISQNAVTFIILLIPFLLSCTPLLGRGSFERGRIPFIVAFLVCALVLQFGCVAALNISKSGLYSPYDLFHNTVSTDLSVNKLGVIESTLLDARDVVFGRRVSELIVDEFKAEVVDTAEEIIVEEPAFDTSPQVLDIDFSTLASQAPDETVAGLTSYLSQVTPTNKNEYTGIFEGKNVIFITAEGFSSYAVSETLTPTLYSMINNGFVFENYYSPEWYGSTSGGEYANLTGLIPADGVVSLKHSGELGTNWYFTLSEKLLTQGYKVTGYHNGSYTYYGRDVSFPNMGFEWIADGSGYDPERSGSGGKYWPQSDLWMMEQTVNNYAQSEPFYTYYMTISGHVEYTFDDNSMSTRNFDTVASLPYSDTSKAYIACNLELEYAMNSLIDQLDAAGTLDDTVIVLTTDHIPYAYTEVMDEIAGHSLDRTFDLYENNLIVWSPTMEEPVYVTRPCESTDILPTMLNLLGIDYDSRLIIGRDALSDSDTFVMFQDRSWISDKGRYDGDTGTWYPSTEEAVGQDYIDAMNIRVRNSFDASSQILETDYYSYIDAYLTETATQ